MKIIRYLDQAGESHHGVQHDDGSATRIEGCIFSDHRDSGEPADVAKLLLDVGRICGVMCADSVPVGDTPRVMGTRLPRTKLTPSDGGVRTGISVGACNTRRPADVRGIC